MSRALILLALLVPACHRARSDLVAVCGVFAEADAKNQADAQVRERLTRLDLATKEIRALRGGLLADRPDDWIAAYRSLAERVKRERLEAPCAAALKVADLAPTLVYTLRPLTPPLARPPAPTPARQHVGTDDPPAPAR